MNNFHTESLQLQVLRAQKMQNFYFLDQISSNSSLCFDAHPSAFDKPHRNEDDDDGMISRIVLPGSYRIVGKCLHPELSTGLPGVSDILLTIVSYTH